MKKHKQFPRSDHREGQIKLRKTYRGRIEGWLESVPGLYGGPIDRKKKAKNELQTGIGGGAS